MNEPKPPATKPGQDKKPETTPEQHLPTVAIIASLEMLGPEYGRPTQRFFGLNLSVGILKLDDEAPETPSLNHLELLADYLKPWTWRLASDSRGADTDRAWPMTISRVASSGKNKQTTIQPVPITSFAWAMSAPDPSVDPIPPRFAQPTATLVERLDRQFGRLEFKKLIWTPRPVKTSTAEALWHATLAEVWRCPAPTGEALNVSLLFAVEFKDPPTGKDVVQYIAAPSFNRLGGRTGPWTPTTVHGPDNGGSYWWRYTPAAGNVAAPRVKLYTRPATDPRTEGPSAALFSFRSLWFDRDNSTPNSNNNWRAGFEQRLAAELNLGRWLADAARECLIPQHSPGSTAGIRRGEAWMDLRMADWAAFRRGMLGVARDRAGLGYLGVLVAPEVASGTLKPPLQPVSTLFNIVKKRAFENSDETPAEADKAGKFWDHVTVALKAYDSRVYLETWQTRLLQSVPALKDNRMLAECRPDPGADLFAMDDLLSALASEDVLRAVVIDQWIDALEGLCGKNETDCRRRLAILRGYLDRVRNGADSDLHFVDLLAESSLAPFWPDLTGSAGLDSVEKLRQSLVDTFNSYLPARFGSPTRPETLGTVANRTPRVEVGSDLPESWLDDLRACIDRRANHAARRLLALGPDHQPSAPQCVSSPPRERHAPHAITFQVDQLDSHSGVEDKGRDAGDHARRIQGVGMLLSEAVADGSRVWASPSVVALHTGCEFEDWLDNRIEPRGESELRPAVVMPVPLHDENQMRHAFVTYDNGPLMGVSPLTRLNRTMSQDASDPARKMKDRALVYLNAARPVNGEGLRQGGEWARVPGLKFGRRYEAALFAVSNCGALPRELAVRGKPAQLRAREGFELPKGVEPRCAPYLRYVPVGGLVASRNGSRGVVGNGEPVEDVFPTIPPRVRPRLRECGDFDGDGKAREGQPPLLLLTPTRSSGNDVDTSMCAFSVEKPHTDLETWDRWMSRVDTPRRRATRKIVRASYTRARAENLPTVALEDPAVADQFLVRLEVLTASPEGVLTRPSFKEKVVALTREEKQELSGGDEIGCLAASPLRVICRTGSFDLRSAGAGSVEVAVPEGVMAEVRVHPMVTISDRDHVFNPAVLDVQTYPLQSPPADFHVLEPFRFWIEVATELLPDTAALREMLEASFDAETRTVQVKLNPCPPHSDHIGSVELIRQVWRWHGRPLGPFPFEDFDVVGRPFQPNGSDAVLDWEADAFGQRDDDDHLLASMAPAVVPGTGRVFSYEESLAEDPRALYFRFGVRAHSRYHGLLQNVRPVTSLRAHSDDVSPTRWRRLLAGCRWPIENVIPKPAIKLLLPLTEAVEAKDPGGLVHSPVAERVPSALLVLNEPWFEMGGLAETMRVEVLAAPDPERKAAPILELGPDPIVDARMPSGSPDAPHGDAPAVWCAREPVRAPIGPIGHTFDANTDNPLYVTASWVIPFPVDLPNPALTAGWYFAKMRFRRVLRAGGLIPKSRDESGRDRESEPTPGYWVQFLPDFSTYTTPQRDLEKCNPRLRNGVIEIDAASALCTYPSQFALYLLVTRRITDATGMPGQESFVDLFWQDASKPTDWRRGPRSKRDLVYSTVAAPDVPPDARLRVMEVQFSQQARVDPAGLLDVLAEALFPVQSAGEDDPPDAQGRIVRISRSFGFVSVEKSR